MSAPTFLSPPGQPSRVSDPGRVQELAAWIVDGGRERPVVVVTAQNDGGGPYFDPSAVQRLVGLAGDVVVVEHRAGGRLTRALARALPDGLMVFNGAARIYWPPGLVGLDPDAHPLIRADSDATPSAAKRARLANRWRQGPTEAHPPHATTPPPATTAAPTPRPDGRDELQLPVVRAWSALLSTVEDRARFPLGPYLLHSDLREQLDALEPARIPVAEAAARVLSGYTWTQPAPTPQRVERADGPLLRATDLAVAWRYPLQGSDRSLYYWQPATGPTVLVRIGAHDVCDLPDARPPRASEDDPGPKAGPRSRRSGLEVADEDLLRVLRDADGPLLAPQIRVALGIPPEVPRQHLSGLLADAIGRGLVVKTGQRRGTRYTAT